ncbi:MAG: MarR family winged helix-turn-helix transcriptional regulator [Planctomycetia bacterium]
MMEHDFDQSIGYMICNTSHVMQNAINDELRAQGVTYRQFQVLACLALTHGDASLGGIADRLGIESATLVGVLDRMERDGWIRRQPCVADRRKKIIRATEQVEPVWEKMMACVHRVRERALAGIAEEDYLAAWRLMERMQQNLGVASGSEAGGCSAPVETEPPQAAAEWTTAGVDAVE